MTFARSPFAQARRQVLPDQAETLNKVWNLDREQNRMEKAPGSMRKREDFPRVGAQESGCLCSRRWMVLNNLGTLDPNQNRM
jgi:hypothetical protein